MSLRQPFFRSSLGSVLLAATLASVASSALAQITFRSSSQSSVAAGDTTRFYMQNAAPDVIIATHRGAWDDTASVLQRKLARTKAGGIANKGVAETSTTNDFDVLVLKFVSEPIPSARTLAGTLNWITGAQESNTAMNANWHVHAYVTQGNTDTVRGTLVTNYTEPSGTNEWPTTAQGDGPTGPVTVSPVAVSANDRIVIEVGYVARNTQNNSRTGTLWYGGTQATDLTAGGNETNTPGWWEFSQDVFGVGDLTIAKPAGTVANDVMVASITVRACSSVDGNPCTLTIAPPAGWTLVNTIDQTGGAGTNGFGNRLFVYYRVATGTEPASYTWTFGGTPAHAGAVGGILSFAGVDIINPIVAEAGQATANSYSHAAPTINTGTVTNTMLVSSYSANSAGTWTPPTGMTEGADTASLAVPNDLGLSIEMNYELRAAAGATGTLTATIDHPGNTPGTDTGATHLLALRPGLDHYAIAHSGNGVTCQAENVTITAKNAANAAVSANDATITITARRTAGAAGNHGDWALVTGTGALANGTADDGVATYTFGAGESQVVLALKDTNVQTVNIDVVDGNGITEATGVGSTESPFDANLSFAQAGFRITDGAGTPVSIATQTAAVTSTTYALQAIRTDTSTGACVGAFASGTDVSVDLAFQCNDPTTCQAAQAVSLTNNSVTGTIAANPNSGVGTYTTRTLRFGANSQAPFTFSYPDVGRITLFARHNIPLGTGAPSGNLMTGSSNPFVVKPSSFQLSNIKRTSDSFANPGAANASGQPFIKAGQSFSATVTAVNALGAATPNYGQEVTPEGVKLTSTLVTGLGLTNNPALGNATSFGTFASGVATGTTFSWGEVGIITLTPSVADADYLGAGDVTGTVSGNVGRFTPDHFALSAGSLTNRILSACNPLAPSTFTYMNEPLRLQFTLTAQNAANATTQNYAGGFAKLSLTSPSAFGELNFGARDTAAGTNLTARIDTGGGTVAGSWASGVAANVLATFAITRAATPDGPFSQVRIGIAPVDDPSDNVQLSSGSLDLDADGVGGNDHAQIGQTQIRFGRLRVQNALGSERLALQVPMQVEYWNGTGFVLNTLDSCTTLARPNVAMDNYQLNLNACETALGGAPVSFSGGLASAAALSAPGSANNGSVDLRVVLGTVPASPPFQNYCNGSTQAGAASASRSYLQGRWTGATYDEDPVARATFGIYGTDKTTNRFIYFRENY